MFSQSIQTFNLKTGAVGGKFWYWIRLGAYGV